MALPTRIANHPIHPMLIPFPIGLWIFSFVCDLLFVSGWAGAPWSEMAFYSMLGGLLGALAAAVFGLGDYLTLTDPTDIRLARTHMVLNLAIVFLYVINVLLRMGTHVPGIGTILLSGVGLLLLGVSGWLGGELVYARGVGVDREGRGRGKKNSTAA